MGRTGSGPRAELVLCLTLILGWVPLALPVLLRDARCLRCTGRASGTLIPKCDTALVSEHAFNDDLAGRLHFRPWTRRLVRDLVGRVNLVAVRADPQRERIDQSFSIDRFAQVVVATSVDALLTRFGHCVGG